VHLSGASVTSGERGARGLKVADEGGAGHCKRLRNLTFWDF
jgi:hypothetical protein